jgi:hypothetical protein
MLTKEQEEKAREIARDITERAANGEFGWRYGIRADISWEEIQELRKNTLPALRLVDGEYVPIEEEEQ